MVISTDKIPSKITSAQSDVSRSERKSYHHQLQRPVTFNVTENSKPPLTHTNKKSLPVRRFRPQHRFNRVRRHIESIFSDIPPHPGIPRPPSRLPSNRAQIPVKVEMGGNSSSYQSVPPVESKAAPATPLLQGRDAMTVNTDNIFPMMKDTPSSNGLVFRKRVSRLQLNMAGHQQTQTEKFLYNGPDTQMFHTLNQNNNNNNNNNISQTIPPQQEGPDSIVWRSSPCSQKSEEYKKSCDSGSAGLITLPPVQVNESPRPANYCPRTFMLPYQDSPYSLQQSPHHSYANIEQLKQHHPPAPTSFIPASPEASSTSAAAAPQVFLVTYPPTGMPPSHFDSNNASSMFPSSIPSNTFPCGMQFTPSIVPSSCYCNSQTLAQQQCQAAIQAQSLKNIADSLEDGFGNPGVPSEIQDDLLRIELLIELRKYKRALAAQLQAQQRLVRMCGSGSSQNLHNSSQNSIPNQNESFRNLLLGTQQVHEHLQHNYFERRKHLMDVFKILSETLNAADKISEGENGDQQQPQQQQQQKQKQEQELPHVPSQEDKKKNTTTVWERDLEAHLASDQLNTEPIMEPHVLKPENSNSDKDAGALRTETNSNPVSLFKGAGNSEDFDTSDKSRSGFPSGLSIGMNTMSLPISTVTHPPNINPLVAAASIGPLLGRSDPNTGGFQNRTPSVVPTVPGLRRQFQQYHALDDVKMFPENLQTIPPNDLQDLKVLEAKLSDAPSFLSAPQRGVIGEEDSGTLLQKLRKPVQVRSPNSPLSALTPVTPVPSTAPAQLPESSGSGSSSDVKPSEDSPSPFFPGFTGEIEMKIKTPEEKLTSTMGKGKANSTLGVPRSELNSAKYHDPKRIGSHIEDMEELERLLRNLPVLTRRQKVEEFAFKTLKPASPVPVAESETSMIPLVSSQGTLATSRVPSSSGRPETTEQDTEVDGMVTETEDEFKNLDTNKMSISELVNLGRKIYRILSQLNTTATTNPKHVPHQVIATPVMLNIPPSSTPPPPVFPTNLNKLNDKSKKSVSHTSAGGMLIDFNSIPNPTFITGPGIVQSKSQPKVYMGSRRTPIKTPNLFKKIDKPPPTRWSRTAAQNQNSHKRSLSSLPATRNITRGRQNMKIGVERTSYVPAAQRHTPKFPILNRFSNNHEGDLMKEPPHQTMIQRKRTGTAMSHMSYGQVDSQPSNTTNTTWGRTSPFKRNFIRENITKVRLMKKIPAPKLLPKPLPPIKKRYENVSSTIHSRSRSRSASAQPNDNRRSSSLPVSPESQARLYNRGTTAPGTGRSSRPPSSLSLGTSRSVSPSVIGSRTGLRYTKTRIMPKTEKPPIPTGPMQNGNIKKFGTTSSFTKPPPAQARASRTSVNGSTKVILRKPRSKTRRVNSSAAASMKSSSTSSVDHSMQVKNLPAVNRRARSRQADGEVKRGRGRLLRPRGNANHEEGHEKVFGEIFKTESEQAIIRDMVKAEMDEIMQKHVEALLRRTKEEGEVLQQPPRQQQQQHHHNRHRPREKKQSYQNNTNKTHPKGLHPKIANDYAGGDSDESSIVMASEKLAPIYTPPTIYDESLFSLEKWVNPDATASAYNTSAKDTPLPTATLDNGLSLGYGMGQSNQNQEGRKPSKLQTVRFSLPQRSPV